MTDDKPKDPDHEAIIEANKEWVNKLQHADQDMEQFLDTVPAIWFRFYQRLQTEGFDKSEAIQLLMQFTHICLTKPPAD